MRLTQLATTIVFCVTFAASALVAVAPAVAQTISDPETGLTVTLPPGYSTSGIQSRKDMRMAGAILSSNSIPNSSCIVIYSRMNVPDHRQHDSDVQNWRDRFGKYSVQVLPFIGAHPAISSVPSFDENYPLRPPARPPLGRMLSVIFKTSNGYLDINCNAADKDFDKVRPVLESLVRGITVPD